MACRGSVRVLEVLRFVLRFERGLWRQIRFWL
jgi:hypothetical protein